MKRIFFLSLIALVGFTFSASAQVDSTDKRTPQQRLEAQMKHLKKQLDLTPQQGASVDSINKVFMARTMDLRKGTADRRTKAQGIKQANDDRNAGMKAVLTADQYTKYEQLQEEQKEKMKERRLNKAGQ